MSCLRLNCSTTLTTLFAFTIIVGWLIISEMKNEIKNVKIAGISTINGVDTAQRPDQPTNPQGVFAKVTQRIDLISRAFLPWGGGVRGEDFYAWCTDPDSVDNSATGMFFIKIPKCASSTGAGVAIRISINTHQRINGMDKGNHTVTRKGCTNCCKAVYKHSKARTYFTNGHDFGRSMLWSIIREPTNRLISQTFFFEVSRGGMEPTDQNVLRTFKKYGKNEGNHQWAWLVTDMPERFQKEGFNPANESECIVRSIVNDYDFIAVAERLDESFVAMKILFRLELGDLLYLSSKTNGGYDDGGTGRCVKIVKANLSSSTQEFLDSKEHQRHFEMDNLLYAAVNQSLDKTIQKIGRSMFEEELEKYQRALKLVQEECTAFAKFPCSPEGELQLDMSTKSCYFNDW
eukprot:CAMPEP_0183299128 /NCGR_PEP_ID=MMETSP0160_2-20130417/5939_1 /TAXON_ID=2839 ORGANISM="Odontella Sinensis, Strain Grunow 1884" /NCGR_SAMPLE_ID=MMETSP0160_2 /ASSEMBLY_ACC=CAM_ASM_000250 /LENGTH=402 /DNA_ID=CAMNT_0025461307 /DNA_START=169 /DNA_END=1374 /DNA_ORIENTATION=+